MEAAHNYKRLIKELHYRFASLAAQENPSSIILGDLITADNESPLVNTLYHDLQQSHLNSTLIRIQHAFTEDNRNQLPLAVARKLTNETRCTLHSRRINHLAQRLQDIFPRGTLSAIFYRFTNIYTTGYPNCL